MTGEEKLTKFLNDLDMSGPYDLKCNHCGAEFHSGFSHECSYEKLKTDNERLRAALKEITVREIYTKGQSTDFGHEAKIIARRALGGDGE